jgi:ABC-type nitrate/sulfonate/bicarbonate transport system permease component
MRFGLLKGLLPLILVLVVWQLVGDKSSSTLPPPSSWWDSLKTIEGQGGLWSAFEKTIVLFFEGLALATIIGLAFGVALGSSEPLSSGLGPTLEFWRTTPAAAIVPAVILLFGTAMGAEIGIVVFGTVWPILLNVTAGRRRLPSLRIDLAHSFHLSWWARMRKIILPSLVPDILTGLRIAGPICLIVVLLVDFLMSTGGLGYLIVQYQGAFEASSTFAIVAVVGVIGYLVTVGLAAAEFFVLRRWQTSTESE